MSKAGVVGRKTWVPVRRTRACKISADPNFIAGVTELHLDIKQILKEDREMSKHFRPKKWSGHPKPSSRSFYSTGYKEFAYVLKAMKKPVLAFGSRLARDPREKRKKIKKKRKSSVKAKMIMDEDMLKEMMEVDVEPSEAVPEVRTRKSILEAIKHRLKTVFDYETTSFEDAESEEESGPPHLDDYDQYILDREGYRKSSVGPATYKIKRFPFDVKPNKRAFNSSYKVPGPRAKPGPCVTSYDLGPRKHCGGAKTYESFGGQKAIVLSTLILCVPTNRNHCARCQEEQVSDFFYSPRYGSFCKVCFQNEVDSGINTKSFKKARHCSFMHYHDYHAIIRDKPIKKIVKSLIREAYIAQYPEVSKKMTPIDDTKPEMIKWLALCRALNKRKRQPLIVHPIGPQEYDEEFFKKGSDDEIDDDDDQEKEESIEEVESEEKPIEEVETEDDIDDDDDDERKSPDRTQEEVAREFQYLKMKGRNSVVPIFQLMFSEEGEGRVKEEEKPEKTDHQKKLVERFGSIASYYGCLIPEFREEGVVYTNIDPESDTYAYVAKGRAYYKPSPAAWESHEILYGKSDLVVTDTKGMKKIIEKKQEKIHDYVKHKRIATPPLPGPRLTDYLKDDVDERPKMVVPEFEKPIVSRDYDIPDEYWDNIKSSRCNK